MDSLQIGKMVPLKDNIDLECFLVTKHSWKGKYKRILAIGNAAISTYNPDKYEATNRWAYSDIVTVLPNKSPSVRTFISSNSTVKYYYY